MGRLKEQGKGRFIMNVNENTHGTWFHFQETWTAITMACFFITKCI